MFVDASAIVAILGLEGDWEEQLERLESHDAPLYISPLVRFEVVQALARRQAQACKPSAAALEEADDVLDAFIGRLKIEEIPISVPMGSLAVAASVRYGKAVGHPAGLNFGDCFAYACAKTLGVPLAYKGGDFALTDLG